jgi:hypothetical protein
MANLIKPENLSLINHPTIKESWIQEQIANDPVTQYPQIFHTLVRCWERRDYNKIGMIDLISDSYANFI